MNLTSRLSEALDKKRRRIIQECCYQLLTIRRQYKPSCQQIARSNMMQLHHPRNLHTMFDCTCSSFSSQVSHSLAFTSLGFQARDQAITLLREAETLSAQQANKSSSDFGLAMPALQDRTRFEEASNALVISSVTAKNYGHLTRSAPACQRQEKPSIANSETTETALD